jgi:hypothetical protein
MADIQNTLIQSLKGLNVTGNTAIDAAIVMYLAPIVIGWITFYITVIYKHVADFISAWIKR